MDKRMVTYMDVLREETAREISAGICDVIVQAVQRHSDDDPAITDMIADALASVILGADVTVEEGFSTLVVTKVLTKRLSR